MYIVRQHVATRFKPVYKWQDVVNNSYNKSTANWLISTYDVGVSRYDPTIHSKLTIRVMFVTTVRNTLESGQQYIQSLC